MPLTAVGRSRYRATVKAAASGSQCKSVWIVSTDRVWTEQRLKYVPEIQTLIMGSGAVPFFGAM